MSRPAPSSNSWFARISNPMKRLGLALALVASIFSLHAADEIKRSAVFVHPDGMGVNTWAAVRLLQAGPDGRLAWDRLPQLAIYQGPMADGVTATSNGGATSHAWGVRAKKASYGMIDGKRIAAARSGADVPVMLEAQRAGKAIGIVNSASVTEPGTGAHLAMVANRKDDLAIAAQLLDARPQVILGGGESFFLPQGASGKHGPGARTDGRNLIEEARAAGYRIVRTRDELLKVPANAERVLGLFASEDSFNEGTEQELARAGKPFFQTQAPRFDEMIAVALRILSKGPQGFLLVGNEEATDNLGGDNHAAGVLEAASGADRAIATVLEYIQHDPEITLVVASDSDCGGLQVSGDDVVVEGPVPERNENGAPQDGLNGRPFLSAPDRAGKRLPFIITWASEGDVSGGLVARGTGPGATLLTGTVDSTDIYSALYLGLFGRRLD
jgi:alkaline phosphatase